MAPAPLKILSVWNQNGAIAEATQGTATTSASYRRTNLVNGSTDGSGTTIMASLNQTASQATYSTRAFSLTSNVTAAAGEIIFASTLTVGAATADGTTQEAGNVFVSYSLL